MEAEKKDKIDIKYSALFCKECDKIYQGDVKQTDAANYLHKETGIKPNSFKDIYQVYRKMLEGKLVQRTLNANLRNYMLNYIHNKYGNGKLEKALHSFLLHIEYYEKLNHTHKIKDRVLYQKYKTILEKNNSSLTNFVIDENEEAELIPLIKDLKREEIIQELKELKTTDPEEITYNTKKYKRDTKTVLQLKELHNYTCQICGKKIRKKDGSFYIEAAHITPKSEKGPELPENLLILCPNHHKEFDYGELEILYRDKEKIRFKLNGEEYCISLKLE